MCAWAELDYQEAYRVLQPDGWLVVMGCAPGALFGEMTDVLSSVYPAFITEVAPRAWFAPDCPPHDTVITERSWQGIPVHQRRIHDFTYVADFGDPNELAAMLGRIYGPVAERYVRDHGQSTFAYRLRIEYGQVAK